MNLVDKKRANAAGRAKRNRLNASITGAHATTTSRAVVPVDINLALDVMKRMTTALESVESSLKNGAVVYREEPVYDAPRPSAPTSSNSELPKSLPPQSVYQQLEDLADFSSMVMAASSQICGRVLGLPGGDSASGSSPQKPSDGLAKDRISVVQDNLHAILRNLDSIAQYTVA